MGRKISYILLSLLLFPWIAQSQVTPPYPFIDTGTEIRLRNSGSRVVRFNTSFLVNQTGGVTLSDSTGLMLQPYTSLAGGTTELRFVELLANGTQFIGLKAPDSIASSVTFTLPSTDSTGTQCLVSDGNATLSWSDCSGGAVREQHFLEVSGTNYVGFIGPDSVTTDLLWKLPAIDSTGPQCLGSNGSGVLSWYNCEASLTIGGNNTQIQFNNNGIFDGSSGLTWNPSTSLLTATNLTISTALNLPSGSGGDKRVEFNSSGVLSESVNFTWNSGTNTLAVTNLSLTNPLTVTSGGLGVATLAANGVLYGNGTSAVQVTAQGTANSVLIANAGAPSFSQQPTLNTGLITKGQVALRLDPYGTSTGNTGELRFLELAANGTNYVAFKAPDSLAASLTFTLPTTDSTGTQCLASNGSQTLQWSGCSASVGGSNTQIQFNNSGVFAGSSNLTWNGTTLAALNLALSNALPVSSGGQGNTSLTTNGILYGNGTSPVNITAQGGANTLLAANNGAPFFTNQPSLAIGIKTFGQDAVEIHSYNTASGATGEVRFLELVANGSNYVGLKAPDSISSNLIWKLPATDSSGTQCISSNGSGEFGWSACSGGTGTPGGSDTQLQYNSSGSFAGSSKMVFDGSTTTIDTLTTSNTFIADGNTFKVDSSAHSSNFGVAGARTGLLKLSGVTSGTVSVTVPAAAGTWTFTLPSTAGTANQALITDGSGVSSWSSVATATNTVTLTNKRITPRMVTMADATSITPTSDTADKNIHTNTQAAGTLTVNAPSGTPTDGQCLWLRIMSENSQALSFNAIYRASSDLPFPTSTTGSSKTDYLLVCYNSEFTKWDYVSKNFGF